MRLQNSSSDSAVRVVLPAGSLFLFKPENGLLSRDVSLWAESPDRKQPLLNMGGMDVLLPPMTTTEVRFDAFCGDSGGSVPRGSMALSAHVAPGEHMASQGAMWKWTRKHQKGGRAANSADQDAAALRGLGAPPGARDRQHLWGQPQSLCFRAFSIAVL